MLSGYCSKLNQGLCVVCNGTSHALELAKKLERVL